MSQCTQAVPGPSSKKPLPCLMWSELMICITKFGVCTATPGSASATLQMERICACLELVQSACLSCDVATWGQQVWVTASVHHSFYKLIPLWTLKLPPEWHSKLAQIITAHAVIVLMVIVLCYTCKFSLTPPPSCPRGLTFPWRGCCGLCQRHKLAELAHSFLIYSFLVSISICVTL